MYESDEQRRPAGCIGVHNVNVVLSRALSYALSAAASRSLRPHVGGELTGSFSFQRGSCRRQLYPVQGVSPENLDVIAEPA